MDFVKFTIRFDQQGRVVEIDYTPIPEVRCGIGNHWV
jgi:hypothetical protein